MTKLVLIISVLILAGCSPKKSESPTAAPVDVAPPSVSEEADPHGESESQDPDSSQASSEGVPDLRVSKEAVLFGDSLAYSSGASAEEYRLSECLSRTTDRKFINKGTPGETSMEALERVDEILAMKSDLVLVSLGGNDILRDIQWTKQNPFEALPFLNKSPYNQDATYDAMSSIFSQLKAEADTVVYLAIDPPTKWWDPRKLFIGDRLKRLDVLAQQIGVIFFPDFMTDLWLNPVLMADEMHPNDAGIAIQCEKLGIYLDGLGVLNYQH